MNFYSDEIAGCTRKDRDLQPCHLSRHCCPSAKLTESRLIEAIDMGYSHLYCPVFYRLFEDDVEEPNQKPTPYERPIVSERRLTALLEIGLGGHLQI